MNENFYYNYIKRFIGGEANNINSGWGPHYGDVKRFMFETAGVGGCVDATMQLLIDDVDEIEPTQIIKEFTKYIEEVKGEEISSTEHQKLVYLVHEHCAFWNNLEEGTVGVF
jgi:hypothetical protein